jgi:hypothetical protein
VLAPAAEETDEGDCDRDCAREESGVDAPEVMSASASASASSSSSSARSCGGDIGRLRLGAVWNGKSVGDMYVLFTFEGPAVSFGSSSMGVIGGGGVSGKGGERVEIGAARKGEEASGAEDEDGGFGLRAR